MTARRAALLVSLALASAGCLPQASTAQARSVAGLYNVFLAASAVIAAIVWGLLTWSILRYRRRRATSDLPPQTHGHVVPEVVWTLLPSLLVLGLFVLTMVSLGQVEARAPRAAARVEVEAFRWGWRFSYPDEGVTVAGLTGGSPEAVLPVGQPVHVALRAADVEHAFYVPEFLFKRDAIPGRTSEFDLTIEQPGVYGGQCAEFCGTYHARMPFTIRAVSADAYRAWLDARRGGGS